MVGLSPTCNSLCFFFRTRRKPHRREPSLILYGVYKTSTANMVVVLLCLQTTHTHTPLSLVGKTHGQRHTPFHTAGWLLGHFLWVNTPTVRRRFPRPPGVSSSLGGGFSTSRQKSKRSSSVTATRMRRCPKREIKHMYAPTDTPAISCASCTIPRLKPTCSCNRTLLLKTTTRRLSICRF